VIDSKKLERDADGKPVSTFPRPAPGWLQTAALAHGAAGVRGREFGGGLSGHKGTRRAQIDAMLVVAGEWLKRHQSLIQRVQWAIVALYLLLIAVPALLPLPDRLAHLWTNLTLFAQFCFWGIWWPFVLLSMVLVGRAWCGLLCPEGALSEAVSRHGRGRAIPRWLTWKGWPFVAFACTTIYGQMISVYQYPKPALLILGGSTAAAILVGYLYGRNKRVWCRYLCPVNGVFGLLSKLAPIHFNVDREAWSLSRETIHQVGGHPQPVNCAPLVALPTMRGGADCHMCGRCSGFRGAISLQFRSPNDEIVHVAGLAPKPWESVLIILGLMGIAAGAFHWSVSPWFVDAKQALAEWLIDHGMTALIAVQPPWWILTNYPERSDSMTLLDGFVLLTYIFATAIVVGGGVSLALAAAVRCLGPWSAARFHHLAQALIPIAACGVFLGLSALTVTILRGEGLNMPFVALVRGALLAGAGLWSLTLGWKIAALYSRSIPRKAGASLALAFAVVLGVGSWAMLFFVW
jgi:polyferredoxin